VQTIASNEEMKQRLIKVMRKGLRMQTAFSGMNAPREAMRQIAQAMRGVLDLRPQIEYTHSCDNAELPQKVLTCLAQQEDAGQGCVFADLEDRLPEDAKFAVQNLLTKLKKQLPTIEFGSTCMTTGKHASTSLAHVFAWCTRSNAGSTLEPSRIQIAKAKIKILSSPHLAQQQCQQGHGGLST